MNEEIGKPIPWGEQVGAALRAMGKFQVDLTKARIAAVIGDPDSDTVAIVIISDGFPGGYALVTDRSTRDMLSRALEKS